MVLEVLDVIRVAMRIPVTTRRGAISSSHGDPVDLYEEGRGEVGSEARGRRVQSDQV